MARERTISLMRKAFKKMERGNSAACSWRSLGICDKTFYDAINSTPELKAEYHEAVAIGQESLVEGIIEDRTAHGKMWLLARMNGKEFGKHKEEEIFVNISEATKKVMKDEKATGQEKLQMLSGDFYSGKIELPLFERLTSLVRTLHPEMTKIDVNATLDFKDVTQYLPENYRENKEKTKIDA